MSQFEIRISGTYEVIDKLFKLAKYLRLLGRSGGSDCIRSQSIPTDGSEPFEVNFDGDGSDRITRISVEPVDE